MNRDLFTILKHRLCDNWGRGDDVSIGEDEAEGFVYNKPRGVAASCSLSVKSTSLGLEKGKETVR